MKKYSFKILSVLIAFTVLVLPLSACTKFHDITKQEGVFTVGMVTDTGGVNDRSFNESAWNGMKNLKAKYGDNIEVTYVESKQEADFSTNFDRIVDNYKLVWGIGYPIADALLEASEMNPDNDFAIVDYSYENIPKNITCVTFRAQEGAFEVGYIAAYTTKTSKVGFVGGLSSSIIDQFEYGYKAGVDFASKEMGKKVSVDSQYTDSFSDAAKGKAIANKMYTNGCDIVFHASGGCGSGVIASAVDNNAYAIGVDSDQAYLAPDHVLTSSLKNVDFALQTVTEQWMRGETIGGKTEEFGVKEGGVGISSNHSLISDDVYNKTMQLSQKIADGELDIPYNEQTYENYLTNLNK